MTSRRAFPALVGALALLGLGVALPPDGVVRGPALLSLAGKWHLVTLHLPAALLLLLPALELAVREREPSRPVLLLGHAAAWGSWVAALLGILHARLNGFAGEGVVNHLWLGIACADLALLAWVAARASLLVRTLLQVTAALSVAVAGHVGGELVHGQGFLTHPSAAAEAPVALPPPAELARLTPEARRVAVYESQVRPILARHCTGCHDARKQKGDLRMDSIAALEKGGENGPALVWGDAKASPIIVRSTLPRQDEDSMPPEPKPMLTATQISLLRDWIEDRRPDEPAGPPR